MHCYAAGASDLWATALHLLGLDHERLTYRFGGRDFRLTDVEGNVVRQILVVVDDFNREAMHIEADTSITSERLIRIFERLRAERGLPQVMRTDNGPEFLGEAFTNWAKQAGMAVQYIHVMTQHFLHRSSR